MAKMEHSTRAEQGQLKVYRSAKEYRDHIRNYTVEVDGKTAGSISAGSSVVIDLDAGQHTVRVAIDWTGSPKESVEIRGGSIARFRVEPSGSAFSAIFQIFTRAGYLKLIREDVTGSD